MQAAEIQTWLIEKIAELMKTPPEDIDVREPFINFGLSSKYAVLLSGELEDVVGRPLSPTLVYEYPCIQALARFLAQGPESAQSAEPQSDPPSALTAPVAIIGIGCRFPGARDPQAFWQLLREGRDAIGEVPADRWDARAFYHPDASVPGKAVTRWGGFLDQVDHFDPFFFGISPSEAEGMDPQQRLLMELAYEALEDAGLVLAGLAGEPVGVFVGISVNEYGFVQLADPTRISGHSGTGNALSIAANRISYFCDFRGPSLAIDTACSSSLMALHLACRSIRIGESEVALAGGVNLMLSPALSIAFTKAGAMAPDGCCKAFDARANGYVRGEGGGFVVLKPLSRALSDSDPIYAVIRGSAANQDGRTNGLMAPSREAQEAVLRGAYRDADVSPGHVQYVEAHGTGTRLGDPIEAKALATVLSEGRSDGVCAIGSVKTNIGHLEAAAGIASLIKVALSLKHRAIPASLHFHEPNPLIPFDKQCLRVQQEHAPWPRAVHPALAGVSSFGFGGTNVHVVLEEAPPEVSPARDCDSAERHDEVHLLPLSAHNPETLQSRARAYQEFLATSRFNGGSHLRDVCYTASVRRNHHDCRWIAVGQSRDDLLACLDAFLNEEHHPNVVSGSTATNREHNVVFVFPGQGSQWLGMGKELLDHEPVFRAMLERCDRAMREHVEWSLLEQLSADTPQSRIGDIDVIQPTIFAIQVALTALWRSWGIEPDAVVGHSMGEVAAAHVAGALALDDAARVICRRSRALKPLSGQGRMALVELSVNQAKRFINGYENRVSVAASNSPNFTVLSGESVAMQDVMSTLERENLFCRPVNVDVASHSPQVDGVLDKIRQSLEGLEPKVASVPVYSTVTGTHTADLEFDANYWVRNLREPVLFSQAVQQLLQTGHNIFIEVSTHPILLSSIQDCVDHSGRQSVLLPSLKRDEPERISLLTSLGALYVSGYPVDWNKLHASRGRCVSLPGYPWQRSRFWMETTSAPTRIMGGRRNGIHPLIGEQTDLAHPPGGLLWQTSLDNRFPMFLDDHRVDGEMLVPASAFMVMALEAAAEAGISNSHVLSELVFHERLVMQEGDPRRIQITLFPEQDGTRSLRVHSAPPDPGQRGWILHVTASFVPTQHDGESSPPCSTATTAIRQRCSEEISSDGFYEMLGKRGIEYGPTFRCVERVWRTNGEALGRVSAPDALQHETPSYHMHPALLDGCLQVVAAAHTVSPDRDLYVPVGCEQLRVYEKPGERVWSHAVVRATSQPDAHLVQADVRVMDDTGRIIAEVLGFSLLRVARRSPRTLPRPDTWFYQVKWLPVGLPEPAGPTDQQGKRWLILTDTGGVGKKLAELLTSRGADCQLVEHGDCFHDSADAEAPDTSQNLSRLLQGLIEKTPRPLDGVVHLWSLDAPHPAIGQGALETAQALGCHSVLHLVQAMATSGSIGSPRLWLITRGAQPIEQGEEVTVAQAPLWGLGKAVGFELPELRCTRIDLDSSVEPTDGIGPLLEQLLAVDDHEDEVAFRRDVRFIPRLLEYAPSIASRAPIVTIGPQRTYLITGGLGGLGLTVAQWLVGQGATHLVLLGRSVPSPTAEAALQKLREHGTEVVVAELDVANRPAVTDFLSRIEKSMPPLRGIVHAAGVLDDGALVNLNDERMAKVMAPKVQGTWNLHTATLNMPLEFFILFSSAVSVLGSPGQANYAAASAFLDAMAHYRHGLGLPAISINWGPWADVGLAAAVGERLSERGTAAPHLVKTFTPDSGLQVLEELIQHRTPQVVALPFNLRNLLELYPAAASTALFAEVGGKESHISQHYARPTLRHDYVAPRNDIERRLAELWRQTLHIDHVGIHDSFFELGGDSVLATQVVMRAQKTFRVRINLEEAFKALTIEQFAEMLQAQLIAKLADLSESEAEELLADDH